MTAMQKPETIGPLFRFWRFLHRPWHEKAAWFRYRWEDVLELWMKTPKPVRLPFHAWFIARNDTLGTKLRADGFEGCERFFVERFLRPGMTVLDIGAHHGLYTLLASRRVGSSGKVFAFEPSPRERKVLKRHLMLNGCNNVTVQELALGEENAESDLYLVEEWAAGCNSLRPPDLEAQTSLIRVRVARLDDWVENRKIGQVDFIKLDVEGGEMSVLRGAKRLLEHRPRPLILAEVQDVRTLPWGYPAKDILRHLCDRNYRWFSLLEDGSVQEMDLSQDNFEGNFVACPEESISKLEILKPQVGNSSNRVSNH